MNWLWRPERNAVSGVANTRSARAAVIVASANIPVASILTSVAPAARR